MKIHLFAAAAAAMSLSFLGTAAFAQATTTSNDDNDGCVGGNLCGMPTQTWAVDVNVAGVNIGQGVGQAGAEGKETNTETFAGGMTKLKLQGEIWGNGAAVGCESDCESVGGAFHGLAQNEQQAGAFAEAYDPKSSKAMAASGVQGSLGLAGILRVGQKQTDGND